MKNTATLQFMPMMAPMNMRSSTLRIMGLSNVGNDGAKCDADGIENLLKRFF